MNGEGKNVILYEIDKKSNTAITLVFYSLTTSKIGINDAI